MDRYGLGRPLPAEGLLNGISYSKQFVTLLSSILVLNPRYMDGFKQLAILAQILNRS